ncbi:UvrD-helicase domain-containing protein [Thioalkalivibrio sp. ALMg11]|uniref:HelD family protein n=1 Tax=Thioalkalivibrio sp. ALMg11 TaxID=1158165 RepID=UPI0003805FC7|nr:UvrD-helicase domain-containing protein [Thioalkalivibrio sp. ALMg11]
MSANPNAATAEQQARDEEQARLAEVHERLARNLRAIEVRLQDYAGEIREQKRYLWDARDEMDHIEKIAQRESIDQSERSAGNLADRRRHLQKLQRSPYFGRFDFARADANAPEPVYIGVHHFFDDAAGENVIHDWRAPIASLFYDYETGPVRFEAPEGTVDGHVHLKRQFRIAGERIELMIDSSVNVVDDVLQDELARNSDEGMKNIVATIQRDQNAIIRDDEAQALIIQGVAGSGKTSIALHRIAWLLYRYKDTLSSEDILIISPNGVFADYISNVLPELGEESVREMGMEEVADTLLEGQYRFQTFFEQTDVLLQKDDPALKRRMQVKAAPEFLKQLDTYAAQVEKNRFQAEDVWIARRLIPAFLLQEIWERHPTLQVRERIEQLLREVEQKVAMEYRYDLTPDNRKQLKEGVRGMIRQSTLRETYRVFFDWLGEPELFRRAAGGRLEYADVFPLIYLKMKLEGIRSPYRNVKHLLVDEMQDYTPVQYAVLRQLFDCRKTILGDASQSVNPYSSSHADQIQAALRHAKKVSLNTSYRSSYEIMEFARQIVPNPELRAIERHDEAPRVLRCKTRPAETEALRGEVEAFGQSGFNTLGVICKTQKQARRVYEALTGTHEKLQILDAGSQHFGAGVIVTTAHMAKGLEFDTVLVPEVSAKHYTTELDRNLLYVACTRAMHRLVLTHTAAPSEWLPDA